MVLRHLLAILATIAVALISAPAASAQTLQVPLHRQQHSLSCEAAALQMALATLGDPIPEDALLASLATDPTPRSVQPDGSVVWGDPEVGFVGAWDGVFARDGYGVYEAPIADLARAEGFANSVGIKYADPTQLYTAVRAGYPVIAWMPYGGIVRGSAAWSTPSGETITYVVTEHAVVLAGVDNQRVTYADPYTGTLQTATRAAFEEAFAALDNRAVIVRP